MPACASPSPRSASSRAAARTRGRARRPRPRPAGRPVSTRASTGGFSDACSSVVHVKSWRWTSVTGSSTRSCAATRECACWRHQRAPPRARRRPEAVDLVTVDVSHLRDAVLPRVAEIAPHPSCWCGEAAVRGRPRARWQGRRGARTTQTAPPPCAACARRPRRSATSRAARPRAAPRSKGNREVFYGWPPGSDRTVLVRIHSDAMLTPFARRAEVSMSLVTVTEAAAARSSACSIRTQGHHAPLLMKWSAGLLRLSTS